MKELTTRAISGTVYVLLLVGSLYHQVSISILLAVNPF